MKTSLLRQILLGFEQKNQCLDSHSLSLSLSFIQDGCVVHFLKLNCVIHVLLILIFFQKNGILSRNCLVRFVFKCMRISNDRFLCQISLWLVNTIILIEIIEIGTTHETFAF